MHEHGASWSVRTARLRAARYGGQASLGATPLAQARRHAEAGEHSTPRESGAVEAGLRLASLSPHSTTLSRSLAPYSLAMAAAS